MLPLATTPLPFKPGLECKCDHHERFGHLPFKTRATYRVWNRIGAGGGALAWLLGAAFDASNISERWALSQINVGTAGDLAHQVKPGKEDES
ncbi:hypothetical protein ColLi_12716 [Colletotrichum liriopes]|uniref:Uncharacterized protein n=1 Tax=Colletotrichum liriopes TaxID=708192 RepID=A0AA37LZX7_9PEZI|nr:hypothetical protein ColLi_12716 [Colletotrichum liriopes]